MLSVRIRGQTYRVSNETLDSVFGEAWRQVNVGLLHKRIQQHHDAGKLVARGHRLEVATTMQEAEQQLRSAQSQEEILRWGLYFLASQVAEAATELRALREAVAFDELAATAKLSRDSEREREHERGEP